LENGQRSLEYHWEKVETMIKYLIGAIQISHEFYIVNQIKIKLSIIKLNL
jgi:hypothetical protein